MKALKDMTDEELDVAWHKADVEWGRSYAVLTYILHEIRRRKREQKKQTEKGR